MPTECERSVASPTTVQANATEIKDNLTSIAGFNEDITVQTMMEGDMSTSQTSTTSNGSSSCNGGRKSSITSPDPTAYVAKARVTRPTPPPPPYNPMQFVQIKPCNLYQTAQEQLKKAEEVKKIKEIRKEEPEDWQNNLDNWKSSRRKRVEHIIDRVVEVKKLELEEHDRTRRKSKTFSEMIEERGERSGGRGLNKLASLAVYAEDEANDLSDLGIGTSSASGKSSLSEDYDNNSVMSDNAAELDKAITNSTHNKPATTESTTREYISSPGYETSSSTAPASSPDPCEYTYEGAIQDYKQRVSRAASGLTSVALNKLTTSQQQSSKESTPERPLIKETAYPPRRGSKIEDRLMGFEVQSPSEECVEKNKVDVPKIDISKRKEIFEAHETQNNELKSQLAAGGSSNAGVPRVTLRDRFKVQETADTLTEQQKKGLKRFSGDITSIKERLQSLEQQQSIVNGSNGATKITANKLVDIPVPPLKERLSSLQNAVTKEEVRKPPVVLVDARQLEIMKCEEEKAQQTLREVKQDVEVIVKKTRQIEENVVSMQPLPDETKTEEPEEVDRDDSGIHTADDVELEERAQADIMKKEQELKLNAAIEALAKEEQQLSEAANAVNQIEAEFEELSLGSVALSPLTSNSNATATPITNEHMEYSVSSTNPQESSTCSNNYSSKISSNNDSSNSPSSGNGTSSSDMVKGLDIKAATNLRRKPTNEMVHAKNLLKIFKETFQNDIELDEHEISEGYETKNIKESTIQKEEENLNIETQVFENSKSTTFETKETELLTARPATAKEVNATYPSAHGHLPASMIPRSMTPLGKPPMSPLAIRANTKFILATPPSSPSLARKNDSQFSINGRVEIFNSKTMTTSLNSSNLMKPTTPTMTTKKTQLPYIIAPKTMQSNNIVLPNQQKQQHQKLPQEATTTQQQQEKSTTVVEPLATTLVAAANSKNQQQQHHNDDENKKVEQMKSMPSQQMVNEPQTNIIDGETYHQHQSNQNNEAVKQQQQPEVVACAPPITILNPDELPKPNTVRNLSSCFQQQQQQQQQNKTHSGTKQMTPKPLPRTRIPQITPPLSPILPKNHICYTTEALTEEKNQISATSKALEKEKKLSTNSLGSTSSLSSNSTTVIDNSKKLSILSNTSSNSEDVTPTFGKTSAQIHKEPKIKENETLIAEQTVNAKADPSTLVKTLDSQTTQALTQEMITAECQSSSFISSTNNTKSDVLENMKIKPNESDKTDATASKSLNIQSTSNLPSTTCLQPLHSPQSEPFKTITPSVGSTFYDKYQTNPLPPNNQRSAVAPLKAITKPNDIVPTVSIPAELPALPDCAPNESSLYKLASSVPHSPASPGTNSEKNLALDSAICSSILTSLAVTPDLLQRQHTVEEELCEKVDKDTLPFHQGSTGFKDISRTDIKRCDGIAASTATKLQGTTQRQLTVEEELCQKVDLTTLPDDKKTPITGYKCVSPTEIRKCDNFFATGSEKPSSKPNSPIIQARAAHSKALIDTCEKIIAEERLTSTQLKSSLPTSPIGSPLMQRKSKIPKPITSCCKTTESLNEADLKPANYSPTKEDRNGAIARLHVVETQIKVTTTTPPASPKVATKPQASPQSNKKTKNIFDFLKKNFGGGSHAYKEESQEVTTNETSADPAQTNKVLVLSEEELQALEKVKYDEVHKFDNSKFYIPSSEIYDESAVPPPLPKTPAPVNIEITRKIITDEILEDGKTEKDLTREIDDLLDVELNKLNHEIEALEKAGSEK